MESAPRRIVRLSLKILSLLVAALTNCLVSAADFSEHVPENPYEKYIKPVENVLEISGTIERGDKDQLSAWLQNSYALGKPTPTAIVLNSPGGNLAEAISMAELIEKFMLITAVPSDRECHSACVFLFIAGAERQHYGNLGIHRPYFRQQYFAGLPFEDAQLKYRELLNSASKWLEERHISPGIIEKMMQTPSNDIHFLQKEEIARHSITADEWLNAKCGYTDKLDKEKNPALVVAVALNDPKFFEDIYVNVRMDGKSEEYAKNIIKILKEKYNSQYDSDHLQTLHMKWSDNRSCRISSIITHRNNKSREFCHEHPDCFLLAQQHCAKNHLCEQLNFFDQFDE